MNTKIRQTLIILSAITACAGCASVAVTDDAIGQRTAFALGIERSGFVISDRQDEGIRTNYTVKATSGKTYSCYVTGTVSVIGRVVSDAICAELGGASAKPAAAKAAPASCNALLKSAGKC